MNRPSIAVVTPSLDQADFLERTIRSVLDQGYPGLEYLVLDGGSSDGSVEIIRRYADRLAYWASGPDGGQAAAVNDGWRRSSGDILGWINSDDWYLPGALATVATAFAEHPEVDVVYGRCRVVGPDGGELGEVGEPFDRRTMLVARDLVPQPSAFIRRAAVERVGPLDERLRYSLDYDLFIRLTLDRPPLFVPDVLAAFTVHPTAKTTRDRARARRETYAVRLRYVHGPDRLRVLADAASSRVLHALPASARAVLDRARGIASSPRSRRP